MKIPGRILAIDPGTKRVGFALSDDLQLVARPLEVWKRRGLEADLERVRALVAEHEVAELLVGMPYRLDGSESPSTERARAFMVALVEALPDLPVRERDEALTSWAAEERLRSEGVHPSKWKEKVDAYAAAALLDEELRIRQEARAQDPEPDDRE